MRNGKRSQQDFPNEELPPHELIVAELAKRELKEFVRYSFAILEPDSHFIHTWHIDAICEHLTAVLEGEVSNLLITVPPKTGKSMICSVMFPAWAWIDRPWIRWLYTSHNYDLAVRDSLNCRNIIDSAWYQLHWGDRFRLVFDQNEKTRYQNSKRGERLIDSLGGGGTGEGGHVIVCLPYEERIATNKGQIPIGEIVERKLSVKVLGSSGTWQEIEKYERNVGREILEIKTLNRTLLCTMDHPIWVEGRGFIPAKDVIMSSPIRALKNDFYLSSMRDRIQSGAEAREALSNRPLLFAQMLWPVRTREKKSGLGRRQEKEALSFLWIYFLLQAFGYFKVEDVQHKMSGRPKEEESSLADLPRLQLPVSVAYQKEDLFSPMSRRLSFMEHDQGWERELEARGLDEELYSGIFEEVEKENSEKRWSSMPQMRRRWTLQHSPYQRHQNEPCAREFDCALQTVPRHLACSRTISGQMAEVEAVQSIRCVGSALKTYNLKVSPDHDYFANGILTHNCDDPHDVEKAVYSKTIRERDIEAWRQKFSVRLLPGAKIRARIIVMQRCHPLDLAGHVLSQGDYVHLDLPMEYRPGRGKTAWYEDPRKKAGELLCPTLHDAAAVADLKINTGSRGYNAQHMQEPASPEGETIKRSWLMRWRALPAEMDEWLQSWDMTFKQGGSSRVSGQVWAKKGSTKYLIDRINNDMGFSATIQAVRDLSAKWPQARTKIIEEAANGPAVIDALQKEIPGLIAWPPRTGRDEDNWAYRVARSSKAARFNSVVPEIEAGNVLLPDPETHPWVLDVAEDICGWPNRQFDDDVDSMVQALLRFASEEVKNKEAFPISVGRGKSYWKRTG